jgi:hypothetical protein
MGTNFFGRIIPSKSRKEKLQTAIENNDFSSIHELFPQMYGNLRYEGDEFMGSNVHLGKRSAGWKFLWNPNLYPITEIYKDENGIWKASKELTGHYFYPLTVEGIKTFVNRDDVEIYDEYGEKQDKEEFLDMAINWVTWKDKPAYDSKTYLEEYPYDYSGYPCNNRVTQYLEQIGMEFISDSKSDFYSDGLRFATTTEFS